MEKERNLEKQRKAKLPLFKPNFDSALPIIDYAKEAMRYYNILFELYATTFKWDGIPEEIVMDGGELFLEKTLCSEGACLFFYDDVLKQYLVHPYTAWGLNFYGKPLHYRVTASNGYTKELDRTNAVEILNSPYYTNEINVIQCFADKLAICDCVTMVNVENQKTPYLIKCTEGQRLTLQNVFKQISEFQRKIFVDDGYDPNSIIVYPLNAPYVADQIYDLKSHYWQEALNYVGVGSGSQKKERVTVNEQADAEGEKIAMIETRLVTRQMAAEQINKMFGLNIEVKVRKDLEQMAKLREQNGIEVFEDDSSNMEVVDNE